MTLMSQTTTHRAARNRAISKTTTALLLGTDRMITRLDTTSYNFIHIADDSLNLFLSIKYFIVILSKVRKVALLDVVVYIMTCKYYEYVVLRTCIFFIQSLNTKGASYLHKKFIQSLALQNPAETLVGGFVEFIRFYTSNIDTFVFFYTFDHLVILRFHRKKIPRLASPHAYFRDDDTSCGTSS